LPLLFEFGIEAVGVVDTLDIATRARIAVPIPGSTDVAGALEHLRGEPEAPQAMHQIQTCEACADHNDVHLRIHAREATTRGTRSARDVFAICAFVRLVFIRFETKNTSYYDIIVWWPRRT